MNATLPQDCKSFNSTCSLHVIYPLLLKGNTYFCIYMFGLRSERSMQVQYVFLQIHVASHRGPSTHKKSAGVQTGIVRCPDGHRQYRLGDFRKFLVLFKYRTMPARAP